MRFSLILLFFISIVKIKFVFFEFYDEYWLKKLPIRKMTEDLLAFGGISGTINPAIHEEWRGKTIKNDRIDYLSSVIFFVKTWSPASSL